MAKATGRDFDSWLELARSDPQRFETVRRAVIEAAIAGAAESRRSRLRCLQWRIDLERERAPNPMAACVSLSRMMWEQVTGEAGLLQTIGRLHGRPHPPSLPARVLKLPRRPDH